MLMAGDIDTARSLVTMGIVATGGRASYQVLRSPAGEVGGELTIATAGPDRTQIVMDCVSDKPSEPRADLIPVAGTVVSVRVPLPEPAADENESPAELLDYVNQ